MVKHSQDMRVNFMYQLDSVTMCPDLRSNIVLAVSMSMYLDKVNV